jgi:hypothetical protein
MIYAEVDDAGGEVLEMNVLDNVSTSEVGEGSAATATTVPENVEK